MGISKKSSNVIVPLRAILPCDIVPVSINVVIRQQAMYTQGNEFSAYLVLMGHLVMLHSSVL